jgi:hypothetical protein
MKKKNDTTAVYSKYVEYIKRTGGSPLIAWFDDDWEPIGKQVRQEMITAGIVREADGHIYLI